MPRKKPLDPKEIASTAYQGYAYKGYGCEFGTFYSIIGLMGEKYGKPYSEFPFTMLEVGKSGISDWGTICGALLGSASALSLSGKAVKSEGDLPTSQSDSVLCHVSVSKWAYSSGISAASNQRKERCARLTSDVASKTWEIIEAKMQGKTIAGFGKSDARKTCGACHDKDKESPILKGNMDCAPCHSGDKNSQNKFKDPSSGQIKFLAASRCGIEQVMIKNDGEIAIH
ncbi:MAG: C-GCAxxG-C-C family protein, partial [Spirochaetales bacterium]|nr:C-GCAxxG-C-C family protein [Spirochaetales bacterium]